MTASPFLLAAQAAAALAAVLALVLLAGRAARRHAPATRGLDPAALRLRATLALDARRRVHLLETPSGLVLALTGGTADQLIPLPAAIA